MLRENIQDLLAFVAVARERSFTRAALKLGVSQSALSHAIRGLETRMGMRLLARTTRSVAPTEAGEQVLKSVATRLDEIETELHSLTELRDAPAGTIRITTTDYAADTVLWPKLFPFLARYTAIKVEMVVDYGLADIVAEGFDIGVRHGDQVSKDMIALRIAPDTTWAMVCSPDYLQARAAPRTPHDLMQHNCIRLRLPRGSAYAWELQKGKRELQVRVEGQVTCSGVYPMVEAALQGAGIAFVPEELVRSQIAERRLISLMADWCPRFPGLHIYYANRHAHSRPMALVIEALRYRP